MFQHPEEGVHAFRLGHGDVEVAGFYVNGHVSGAVSRDGAVSVVMILVDKEAGIATWDGIQETMSAIRSYSVSQTGSTFHALGC